MEEPRSIIKNHFDSEVTMVVLCLFCLELLVCVALGWPIVAALLVGLVLFVGWALR